MDPREDEIYIGESHFHVGEDNIFYNTIVGEIDVETATKFREYQLEVLNNSKGKIHSLVDLNQAGMPTTSATQIGRDMFNHEKMGKVALFGLSRMAEIITNFMVGITGKRHIRHFKTEEEALKWLKK
jgi:hypothetical protein